MPLTMFPKAQRHRVLIGFLVLLGLNLAGIYFEDHQATNARVELCATMKGTLMQNYWDAMKHPVPGSTPGQIQARVLLLQGDIIRVQRSSCG